MIHHMPTNKSVDPKHVVDPITAALAETLRDMVKDQHRTYPSLTAFTVVAGKRAGVNPETIARILRAETTIRADYLFHMADLLNIAASDIVALAEAKIPQQRTRAAVAKSDSAPLPSEISNELERMANTWLAARDKPETGQG